MNAVKIISQTTLKEIPLVSPNKFKGSNLAAVKMVPYGRNSTRIVETIIKLIFGLKEANSIKTALVCLSIQFIFCNRLKLPCKKLN